MEYGGIKPRNMFELERYLKFVSAKGPIELQYSADEIIRYITEIMGPIIRDTANRLSPYYKPSVERLSTIDKKGFPGAINDLITLLEKETEMLTICLEQEGIIPVRGKSYSL